MEFKTEAQKVCYEKVKGMLKELFGEMCKPHPDQPVFNLVVGSALATTCILPWKEDDALVVTRSWVVTGAETTLELTRFLLEENVKMNFGSFGMDPNGNICFQYNVIGSTIDRAELKACVLAVAQAADNSDDKIMSRWGGQRAVDRMPK